MHTIPQYQTTTYRPIGNIVALAHEGPNKLVIVGLRADYMRGRLGGLSLERQVSIEDINPGSFSEDEYDWISLIGKPVNKTMVVRSKNLGCARIVGIGQNDIIQLNETIKKEIQRNDIATVFIDWK